MEKEYINISSISDSLRKHKKILLNVPRRSGKSHLIARLAGLLSHAKEKVIISNPNRAMERSFINLANSINVFPSQDPYIKMVRSSSVNKLELIGDRSKYFLMEECLDMQHINSLCDDIFSRNDVNILITGTNMYEKYTDRLVTNYGFKFFDEKDIIEELNWRDW